MLNKLSSKHYPSPHNKHNTVQQRELFQAIPNGGKGDCGPAALWHLIYGGRPTSRDLKEMRNQAVDQVGLGARQPRSRGSDRWEDEDFVAGIVLFEFSTIFFCPYVFGSVTSGQTTFYVGTPVPYFILPCHQLLKENGLGTWWFDLSARTNAHSDCPVPEWPND